MTQVFASRKRGDDFESSYSKLVSAFLSVAEDLAAEQADRVREDAPRLLLAAEASEGVVARSDTPEQGANGRGCGPDQSAGRGRTKRRSA
jgi:hypothetical protein